MGRNDIRFFRLRKGITQVDLAKAIGVSQQAVAKWENDESSVSLEYLPKLEKALGIRKELLFPDLLPESKREQEDDSELREEALELVMPHEIVLHFKNRKAAYCASISGKHAKRLRRLIDDSNNDLIWFETLGGMLVAVNPQQLRMIELGQDLAYLPEETIKLQKLGERDPDFESNGDDRHIRIFIAGHSETIDEYPDPERDFSALSILDDALSGFYDMDSGFASFYSTSDDEAFRKIYFRPTDLELIEGPLSIYNEYADRIHKEIMQAPKKSQSKKKAKAQAV